MSESKSPWKVMTLDGEEDWEILRYRLEKTYRLHQNKFQHSSFLLGYRAPKNPESGSEYWSLLKSGDPCSAGDFIVLRRRPLPSWGQNHVPLKVAIERLRAGEEEFIRAQNIDENDEESLIKTKLVFESEVQKRLSSIQSHRHCSERSRTDEIPSEHYVCRRCGVGGHWLRDCASKRAERVQRCPRLPTGIPRSLLRRAVTQEEKERAYQTDQGELLVLWEKQL